MIDGHKMDYEMVRSKTPSVFGIQQSRIYELNLYRDGTLTADYNKRWLRTPYIDDEVSKRCIDELVDKFGSEKVKERSKNS